METNFKHWFGLQLHITDKCDQRCTHCYIFNTPTFQQKELSLEHIKTIVENFKCFCESMECNPSIAITGGDPLLNPNIWNILRHLKKNNIPFDILGNPFHLTPSSVQKLVDFGCQKYQLSIDGLKITHDKLRKRGSFDATVEAIKILNNFGLKSHIMMTVSSLNYLEVPKVIEFVSQIPASGFSFARYCPTPLDRGLSNISPNEYRNFLSIVWDTYKKLANGKTKFFLKDHLWTPFLYEEGLFHLTQTDNIIYEGCGCAIRHMCVLPDGEVYACRRFQSPIGNCLQESFSEIFWGEKISHYREYEKMECFNCELFNYCRGCPAVSYGTSGSFYKKDPQCWRVIK